MIDRQLKRTAIPLFCIAVAVLFAGCASVPNVGPFVDATAQLRSAVVASGTATVSELREMPDGADFAKSLEEKWKARAQAANGLVAYAESLQSVVKSGQQGEQAVRSVSDSVSKLAGAAGIAMPAAGTAQIVVDAAALVYQQIALMRASKTLDEALTNAQPAVQQISAILAKDMMDLRQILKTAGTNTHDTLEENYQDQLKFRSDLEKERDKLYGKGLAALSPEDKARLLDLDKLFDTTKEWYDPYQAEQRAIEKRLATGRSLIDATAQAIAQWAAAHEQLVAAVRDKRPVNADSLVQATVEVRDLVKRIREL